MSTATEWNCPCCYQEFFLDKPFLHTCPAFDDREVAQWTCPFCCREFMLDNSSFLHDCPDYDHREVCIHYKTDPYDIVNGKLHVKERKIIGSVLQVNKVGRVRCECGRDEVFED